MSDCYEKINCETAKPYQVNGDSPFFQWKPDDTFTKCRKLNNSELDNACESKNYVINTDSDGNKLCVKPKTEFKVYVASWYNDTIHRCN